jgi:PTS system nitrogen regulatory IIA component
LPELNQALVAFVRTGAALPFDSPDAEPVSLFWVLLVPTDAPEQSLKLLADAAEIFSKAYLRENLRVAGSADAVLAMLRERA